MSPKNLNNHLHNYSRYSSIALQMGIIIIAGVFGGYYLDKFFAFKYPVLTVCLSLISVGISIYIAVKDLLK